MIWQTFVGCDSLVPNKHLFISEFSRSKRRYKEVQSRDTVHLLPACVDDYVAPDKPVRAIDAFVASLDLQELGFGHTDAYLGAGHPADDPGLLLKLFIYGYQNKVRRSRAREAETRRNTEVMWLGQGVQPRYKTSAAFRKDNSRALQAASRDFVQVFRELALIGGRRVTIDGTHLKAYANPSRVHTKGGLKRQIALLEKQIAAYYKEVSAADEQGTDEAFSDPDLVAKMTARTARLDKLKEIQGRLEARGKSKLSEGDPDARYMHKRQKSVVGFKGQIVVDDQSKLIGAVDLVKETCDQNQLGPMMTKAQEAMGSKKLLGLADRGYVNYQHFKTCEDQGMEVYVPLKKVSPNKGSGNRYVKDAFTYDREEDHYVCPAGQKLVRRGARVKRGGSWSLDYSTRVQICRACPLTARCLPPSGSRRCIGRWEHEDVVDRHRDQVPFILWQNAYCGDNICLGQSGQNQSFLLRSLPNALR